MVQAVVLQLGFNPIWSTAGGRLGMNSEHAYACLSAATDFNIFQVVNILKGVNARTRVADFGA